MRKYSTCDFSFAGLKTSTRLAIEQRLSAQATQGMAPEAVQQVCAAGEAGWARPVVLLLLAALDAPPLHACSSSWVACMHA